MTLVTCGSVVASAQSSDQNYPTPILSNEIAGTIRARDIGDARLTTYYFMFGGYQGDIFINVVTKNFTGDIDIFNADGLRPLTKMVIYAAADPIETGRLVYLRKSEKLLLRIQGRTPNDDAANFRIRFGGSFVASTEREADAAPTVESGADESGLRVNSVGTRLPPIPKPSPEKKIVRESVIAAVPTPEPEPEKITEPEKKPEPVVEPKAVIPDPPPVTTAPTRRTTRGRRTANPPVRATRTPPPPVEKKPDPLASIRLIIQLKTGETIERPMSAIRSFSVINAVLVVVAKDGKTNRYSILDVAKLTVE